MYIVVTRPIAFRPKNLRVYDCCVCFVQINLQLNKVRMRFKHIATSIIICTSSEFFKFQVSRSLNII